MERRKARVLQEGLYAGVIGYVTVALLTGLRHRGLWRSMRDETDPEEAD